MPSPSAVTHRDGGRAWHVQYEYDILCDNMSSSTQTDARNTCTAGQRTAESRPCLTYTENCVKFGHVFETCERAYRGTDIQTYFALLPGKN